jgi:hypothetical protein
VNTLGEVVIPPRFEFASDFHEGLAAVQINGKMGYIDPAGQWAIKPIFAGAGRFSEGLAGVRKEQCTARVCQDDFIDKTGAVVLHGIASAREGWFSDGMARV